MFHLRCFTRAVLLLLLGLMIMAPAAMAYDAMTAVLPNTPVAMLGNPLEYFWEEGISATGRTPFKSFLTTMMANPNAVQQGVLIIDSGKFSSYVAVRMTMNVEITPFLGANATMTARMKPPNLTVNTAEMISAATVAGIVNKGDSKLSNGGAKGAINMLTGPRQHSMAAASVATC